MQKFNINFKVFMSIFTLSDKKKFQQQQQKHKKQQKYKIWINQKNSKGFQRKKKDYFFNLKIRKTNFFF